MNGRLVIVGTGIGFTGNLSLRAKAEIASAESVFYLVTEDLTAAYICELNSRAESLYGLYDPALDRIVAYRRMIERILNAVRSGKSVCAVFYGHPGIFVYPSHECIVRARREGFDAVMLPAVSAEDCLFADLGIDPGRVGCQSFEVNDFLIFERHFDPCSVLVLWQIGVIGEVGFRKYDNRQKGLAVLRRRLLEEYPDDHVALLYEASELPVCDPVIEYHRIQELHDLQASPIATLVIPPRALAAPNLQIAAAIGIPREYIISRIEADQAYDALNPCAALPSCDSLQGRSRLYTPSILPSALP